MSNGSQAPSELQRIVIHHLSDLHYQQESSKNGVDPLVRYRGYLEELRPERRPDLLVITGDVTATGAASDLNTVVAILRSGFPKWESELAQHIIIVPGPRDVNWEGSEPPALTSFYKALSDFALPSDTHTPPKHGTTARPALNCITYPLDTCYSLDECRADMKDQFRQYAETYHEFVRRYQQVRRSLRGPFRFARPDRKKELANLRERYLLLTEANELTMLDAGRVHADDLSAFDAWVKSWETGKNAGDPPGDPLKILITHHPVVVQPESKRPARSGQSRNGHFEQLATSARAAGFHLALHGHIHKPQVLSDLSLMQGPDVRHPMRQVGAGSLGDGLTFNEITATYPSEGEQRQWRLEIRTINLAAAKPDQASSSLMLLNPSATIKSPEQLAIDKTRQDFDERIRSVMRQFSEAVYRAQPEGASDRTGPLALPQAPLLTVDSVIRDVVFPRRGSRVRLFLKEQQVRPIPKLTAVYLAPPDSDGTGPVQYPVSLAALSLVLGRTLSFPKALDEHLDERDHQWLRRTGRDRELDKTLEALFEQTLGSSYPGLEGAQRYDDLRNKLARWLDDPARADVIYGRDFYQDTPQQGAHQTYPYFICVPFPQRPQGAIPPEISEVAVLVVSVKAAEERGKEREEGAKSQVTPDETFAAERIGMLESLAELTGTILIASSALNKPKGVWDDRFRV